MQSCVFRMIAERDALSIEDLHKALGVRGAQIRHMEVAATDQDLEETTIHLVRVSQADIRAGAARLRSEPGVQSVTVTRERKGRPVKSENSPADRPEGGKPQ